MNEITKQFWKALEDLESSLVDKDEIHHTLEEFGPVSGLIIKADLAIEDSNDLKGALELIKSAEGPLEDLFEEVMNLERGEILAQWSTEEPQIELYEEYKRLVKGLEEAVCTLY